MAELIFYPVEDADTISTMTGAHLTYPPPVSYVEDPSALYSTTSLKTKTGEYYSSSCTFLRFDTSGLPDAAVITVATLKVRCGRSGDADGRNLNVEWYDPSNWPIQTHDHVDLAGTNAASVDLSLFPPSTAWDFYEIALSNPTNVSKTGFTGFRLGISGNAPSGDNSIMTNNHHAEILDPAAVPQLIVTYNAFSHKVLGCLPTTIAKIMDIPIANISKFNGV